MQNSSWGEVGSSLDALIEYMDRSERQGAEEGKEELGSSPNRRKHAKLNKFKGRALKSMDSTSFTHSFSFRSIRREWHTLNVK